MFTGSKIDYRLTPDETLVIKAFAIIAMLVHHLFHEHPEFGEITTNIAMAGKVCVALFVFLSGYGMAASFPEHVPNKIKTFFFFLCRRYIKFYTNYWFIFIIAVPIGVFCFNRTLDFAYGEKINLFHALIRDFLGLQGLRSYNITWWFNNVILVLWLFFPFLYWAMKSKIVSLCFLLLLFVNPDNILYPLNFLALGLPTYILPFTTGIFIALHINRISNILNLFHPYFVFILSVIMASVLLYLRGFNIFCNFTQFRVDPFATIFIVLAVISICRVTQLKFKFLQYVGKHSMNMYLTHTFIFAYFFSNFIYGFKYPPIIFGVLFVLSLALSVCIEFFKKKVRFYKVQSKVVGIINQFCETTSKNSLVQNDNRHPV